MKIRKYRGKTTSECSLLQLATHTNCYSSQRLVLVSEYIPTYVSVCVNANTAQCVIGMEFLGEQLFRLLSVYITARKP